MNRFLIIIIALSISTVANADVKRQALSKASEKISEYVLGAIPGDGTTEFDIQFSDKDDNEPRINFLILRDLQKTDRSNFFTQMSLHTQDVGGASGIFDNDNRYIGNIGYGYRQLSEDNSYMLGANIFYDRDIKEGHSRASIGLEAKAGILDFNFNHYEAITLQRTVGAVKEQALGGTDYTLATQVPYMPWAKFNFTGYKHKADLAATDSKGRKYMAEMNITSSLIFEAEFDESRNNADDYSSMRITFVYPPRNSKPSLIDGFMSTEKYYVKDITSTLSEKVKRNNNIAIETQGAVIITVQ